MTKIVKTKSNKWHAKVYMGKLPSGKMKFESITDEDKRIVAKAVRELEMRRDSYNDPTLLSNALDAYNESRKPVLSPSTMRGYISIANILKKQYEQFCSLKTTNIGKKELQSLVSELVNDGKSPKRIRNIIGFVGAVLRHYDCDVPRVALPEKKIAETYEPTKCDIDRLRELSSGTELDIPIRLGLHGLRQGEVCALKYPDDFQNGYIIVSKSMVEKPDLTYTIKSPKNITSNRRVPIFDNSLVSDIEKQGFVTDMLPDTLGYRFAAFIKKNNLPHIRFHDLRHYFASYLHSKGVPDALIMKYGGWKTDSVMKRVYRYAMDDDETTAKMRDLLSDGFNYVV